MTGEQVRRLQGLQALIEAGVEHGCSAVERVHLETARRPFAIAESLPSIATPARVAHAAYDAVLRGSYGTVRLVNRLVGRALAFALHSAKERSAAR